ncbi:MAG: hypothetical protein GYA21_07610 [Myxococcales bacterium]|nr:hypothetical protein [Myxococcales bacterium]
MNENTHRVVARGERAQGGIDSFGAGALLQLVRNHLVYSSAMAFRGASKDRGRPPQWLARLKDIRLVGMESNGSGETNLYFRAPRYQDAAGELYEQAELWPTRPDPCWTSFESYAEVVRDIKAANKDSDRFDRTLLENFVRWDKKVLGYFDQVIFEEHREGRPQAVEITRELIREARKLDSATPKPRLVQVVGMLDMLRASAHAFGLCLDDGVEVRGVFEGEQLEGWRPLLGQRVLVQGSAIYKPSGKLLRIDATSVSEGSKEPALLSKIPPPLSRSTRDRDWHQPQTATSGVNAFFGKIPADDDPVEFARVLKELS